MSSTTLLSNDDDRKRTAHQSKIQHRGSKSPTALLPLMVAFALMGWSWSMHASPTTTARYEWQRVKRVEVFNSDRRARYPSITRAADGSLLVLFTQMTAEQETIGRGDLLLVRSTDGGQSWSDARVLFRGHRGEPRALGTMTALANGQLIAPFTELANAQTVSTVRLLTSSNNGNSWKDTKVNANVPLVWWAPCGKLIESADGTLVMAVYGAAVEDQLKATIHGCGLLRSTDGGKTWGDFSWIAKGPSPMIGASPSRRFSFQGPFVQPLPDGRWLAMVTARRLNKAGDGPSVTNEGPGAPQVLCRLWSSDQGRTWTKPDQLMPGAWPALTTVGEHTLCVNTLWCGWGAMRLDVSRDGFDTFFQELMVMERGWTRGGWNNPVESPLPPTVPYLADAWSFEHYGYPSALPLDEDRVIVVFGRTQQGTPGYPFDPKSAASIPEHQERIQSVFFRRSKVEEPRTSPLTRRSQRPRGRWVLDDRIVVKSLGSFARIRQGELIGLVGDSEGPALAPNEISTIRRSSDGGRTWGPVEKGKFPEGGIGAFAVLRSGRWLITSQHVNQQWKGEGVRVVGMDGGYSTFKSKKNQSYDSEIVVQYSDDQGLTWHASSPFKGPFKWAIVSANRVIEDSDGVLAIPVFGCVTDEEMSSYSSSNGVIRSHDGGKTWGDFSFIFRTQPPGPGEFQHEPRYSEMDVVSLSNGHWVAYSRHERLGGGPHTPATAVAISTDFGRTWTKSGGSLAGVSQQKGIVLPDGGIALSWRASSWQSAGVAITYDEGRSFDYLMTGPYETINAHMNGNDEFIVYTIHSRRSDMTAGVYRWVPE